MSIASYSASSAYRTIITIKNTPLSYYVTWLSDVHCSSYEMLGVVICDVIPALVAAAAAGSSVERHAAVSSRYRVRLIALTLPVHCCHSSATPSPVALMQSNA